MVLGGASPIAPKILKFVIPEPSSIVLLAIAAIGAIFVRSRRRGKRGQDSLTAVLRVSRRTVLAVGREYVQLRKHNRTSPDPFSSLVECVSATISRVPPQAALLSIAILLKLAATADAQYIFTTIDFPGAVSTSANSINNNGYVVGSYVDVEGSNPRGYLFDGIGFTTIDFPGADVTVPRGINDSGHIVGSHGVENLLTDSHGFLFDGAGYTQFDFPGSTLTGAGGINNQGEIVGGYSALPGQGHGFLFDGMTFSSIDFPGAGQSGASAINDNHLIVGSYGPAGIVVDAGGAFIFDGATFADISIPDVKLASASGINNLGHVVGWYTDGGLLGRTHGFLFDGTIVRRIDFPDALSTYPSGINDRGHIVGSYLDSGNNIHGYVAVPEPSSLVLMLIATIIGVALRFRFRSSPQTTKGSIQ